MQAAACGVLLACGGGSTKATGGGVDAGAPLTNGLCAENWDDTPFANAGNPFAATGCAVGDAVLIQIGCAASTPPSAVSVTAPGWTFAPIGTITGSASGGIWAATFGAIVPNLAPQWFMISWDVTCTTSSAVGDELRGADPSGGASTFDSNAEVAGSGDVDVSLTTTSGDEIVWAAGSSLGGFTGWQPGSAFGMSDDEGDLTLYRYTSDPANSNEEFGFMNPAGKASVVSAVALQRAP